MAQTKTETAAQEEPCKKPPWISAEKPRENIGAAVNKFAVLGFIVLKYLADSFEEFYATLKGRKGQLTGANTHGSVKL